MEATEKAQPPVLCSAYKVLQLLTEEAENASCDHYLAEELRTLLNQLEDVANEEKKLAPSKVLQVLSKAVKEAKAIIR